MIYIKVVKSTRLIHGTFFSEYLNRKWFSTFLVLLFAFTLAVSVFLYAAIKSRLLFRILQLSLYIFLESCVVSRMLCHVMPWNHSKSLI